MTVLITGGAKNGKSLLAQDLTLQLAKGGRHYYVATMIPSDAEDDRRIVRHLEERAGLGFETIECGRNILSCLEETEPGAAFLLDSVTALLMNELFPDPASPEMDREAPERVARQMVAFAQAVDNAVIVSDAIYADAALYDEVTETYRKGLAKVDRALAAVCDTVLEIVAGNIIIHKGGLPL